MELAGGVVPATQHGRYVAPLRRAFADEMRRCPFAIDAVVAMPDNVHALWTLPLADFANHVDYIHHNPVKHGYAQQPEDWPYSSIHRRRTMA